ncbi:MAG: hypothetical protein JWN71_2229 [Xanthobacteraceae bacterium]|jgi:hypothetical protein|nr:hypothetical protein [Xanthobacteraceae bacterium]
MVLLLVYVAVVLVCDVLAYGLAYYIDKTFPLIGLPTFLALFFAVLVIAWYIAVRITEPKAIAKIPGAPAV